MSLRFSSGWIALCGVLLTGLLPLHAQGGQGTQDAKEIVKAAVKAEIAADQNDHARWRYKDERKDDPDKVSIVVQTAQGSVERVISKGGRPLSEAEARAEDQRVQEFIHDDEKLAKQRRDGQQDGKNAAELSNMLPEAFIWKVQSEDAQKITLHFQPNPNFNPPDMQSRVLGDMMGELVVDKAENRIMTISGKLVEDVTIGWGLLGRLHQGGTFRVERRQVAPGYCRLRRHTCILKARRCSLRTSASSRMKCRRSLRRFPMERRSSRRRRCRRV